MPCSLKDCIHDCAEDLTNVPYVTLKILSAGTRNRKWWAGLHFIQSLKKEWE